MFQKKAIGLAFSILVGILLIVGGHRALANSDFSLDADLSNGFTTQHQVEEGCAGPLHRAQIHIRPTDSPEYGWQVNCNKAKTTLTYPESLVGTPTEGYAGFAILRHPRVSVHYSLWAYATPKDASAALTRWSKSWRDGTAQSPEVSYYQVLNSTDSIELTIRDNWGLPEWKRAILKGNKVLTVDIYALPVKMPAAYLIRLLRAGHKFQPADEKSARLFVDEMLHHLEEAERQGETMDIPAPGM